VQDDNPLTPASVSDGEFFTLFTVKQVKKSSETFEQFLLVAGKKSGKTAVVEDIYEQ